MMEFSYSKLEKKLEKFVKFGKGIMKAIGYSVGVETRIYEDLFTTCSLLVGLRSDRMKSAFEMMLYRLIGLMLALFSKPYSLNESDVEQDTRSSRGGLNGEQPQECYSVM